MQTSTTTSLTPQSVCCCYPIPNHLRRNLINFPSSTNQTHFPKTPFLPLSSTTTTNDSISKQQQKKKNNACVFQSYSTPSHAFLEEFYSYTDNSNQIRTAHNQKQGDRAEEVIENRVKKSEGIFTSMWWADLRAAMGQRINFEAIVCSAKVVTKDRHLAIPHIAVPDIRHIDWAELRRRGFKGVVFDKDNTITAPYSLKLWGPLGSSLEQCKSVFGDDIAVFSNSSGLYEYDPDFSKARILESAIGIKVLRHKVKKPAGTAEEIEEHFGCESSKLIMVGDRPLTDIVYGNRNGFLTILTEPLTLVEEPFIVKQVRKLETFLVNRWCKRGLRPTSHNLLPDVMQCVKDPPSLFKKKKKKKKKKREKTCHLHNLAFLWKEMGGDPW